MLSSGKDITVCAAFALARGGVSIYFENSEDRDKALKKLPKESFGGGSKKTLSPTKKRNLYLKGIDTAVSESVIADTLQRLTGEEVYKAARQNNRKAKTSSANKLHKRGG